MVNQLHNIVVLIDIDREEAYHWFELFQNIKKYLRSNIQFIMWDSQLADIARSIVDIDTVHLLNRSLFKLNDYKSINSLVYKYSIDKCIEIGKIPQFISWKLKQNNILKTIRINYKYSLLDKRYDLMVYDSNTPKISYKNSIFSIPFPKVNYKHFLDLDTQKVLNLKQNIGLLSYDNQVIHKSFVCGYIGDLDTEFIKYINYNNFELYDVLNNQGSFVLPNNVKNNLPVLYELLDCLIVRGDINENIRYNILNAMASGTIVISPRDEIYQEILGRGALYYTNNSELFACIEAIQKNDMKKTSIRDLASEQFQRKYSYQAIAHFWSHLLAKI